MNDINDMPPKCRDCQYWEFAEHPYVCFDCEQVYGSENERITKGERMRRFSGGYQPKAKKPKSKEPGVRNDGDVTPESAIDRFVDQVNEQGNTIEHLKQEIEMLKNSLVPLENSFVCPLPVKRLHPDAKLPTRGSLGSAGLDLYSVEDVELRSGDITAIHPGISIAIPRGYYGQLCTRSSMGKAGVRIAAGMNVIGSDYRGEVLIYLRNDGDYEWKIKKGDRVAQIVISSYAAMEPAWTDELSKTQRGTGGFGSTGR